MSYYYYNANMASILYILFILLVVSHIISAICKMFNVSLVKMLAQWVEGDEYDEKNFQ